MILLLLLFVLCMSSSCDGDASATAAWDHAGWACLRHTTPNLHLEYPSDAEEHFEHVHRVLANWSQPPGHQPHKWLDFEGPWIENLWIDRARQLNTSRFRNSRFGNWHPQPLSAVFGPFIPLLITWVDSLVANAFRTPPALIAALKTVLRPTVPYVTISQNDQGITGSCELPMKGLPNVLVFSAGGYGHVPIPMLLTDLYLPYLKPPEQRKYLISYVGNLQHSKIRRHMNDVLVHQSRVLNFSMAVYHGPDWMDVMADSRASLAPRGFGRTSFHLAEIIQAGLIPIYVFSDIPWVPYPRLYGKFGYATNVAGLPAVLTKLARMNASAFAEMEKVVALHRPLFLPNGVLEQIFNFLQELPTELVCVTLPPTPRDGKGCG